jgi:hypothetical protein
MLCARWSLALSTVAAAWHVCLLGHAQLSLQEGATDADAEQNGHEPGRYTGVKLGDEQAPPASRVAGSAASITWPGFQMKPDGGSVVFLQTTAALATTFSKTPGKLIVDLGEVRVEGNNRLPLQTSFFNTPVTRVQLKRAHKRTTLELSMRADVEARIESAQAKSGYHFVYVHLPAGSYLPAAASSNPRPGLESASPSTAGDRSAGDLSTEEQAELDAAMNDELPPGMAAPKLIRRKVTIGGRARTQVTP